jgi:hypothetical protein
MFLNFVKMFSRKSRQNFVKIFATKILVKNWPNSTVFTEYQYRNAGMSGIYLVRYRIEEN